jgi:hypothetical protein
MAHSSKIDEAPGEASVSQWVKPSHSPTGSSIIELRNLLAQRFPQPRTTSSGRLATGLASLDEAIGGGLPKGAITELTSPNVSAGSALLISTLLQTAQREGHFLALIDGRDSFDPQPLGNACLLHLLWVRCAKAFDAVKAADLLLRDGNFPLVILDLVLNAPDELRKIPSTSWYRLQRLVELVPTAFLVLTRRSMISSAQWKLVLENNWQLDDLESDDSLAELQFQVQRAHGGRQEMAGAG